MLKVIEVKNEPVDKNPLEAGFKYILHLLN